MICIGLGSYVILKFMARVFLFHIQLNEAAIVTLFGKIIKVDQKPGFYLTFL